jgi:hypothetical protein
MMIKMRRQTLGLILSLFPVAAMAAPAPDPAPMAQREIALITFYGGGSPLTAQEQQEATDMVRAELQSAPRAELAADAGAARLLDTLRKAPAPLIAQAREGGRLNVQLQKAVDPALQNQQQMEARIIEAHDPVVVFDPTHQQLITQQTLRVMQHADFLGANVFGVSPPGDDFITRMQGLLPQAWNTMDPGMRDAMAHAERDLPYAPAFLQGIEPPKRDAFIQTWHAKITAASDAGTQQLNLSEVMAVIGMTAYRHTASNGKVNGALADRLNMQNLVNRKMQEAVRSYSPTCNVTRPDAMQNWASCHP